ncbi:MAG: dockerin type I domain-containing protein [Microgenomates group bacterium]|jgi:hypothetical protein
MISKLRSTISKINTGVIKIPTLLGIGVLLIGLAGGVYLATQNQTLKSKAAVSAQPKNVNVVNLSGTSAAIYWQTDEPSTGYIKAGIGSADKQLYRDDRDTSAPTSHKLHFVTLTNLQQDTTYSYFIYSDAITYPQTPLNFKTALTTPNIDWPPLVGTIIDTNNAVLDEAIIALSLPEAQRLATITKTGGNFILPLSDIKTADLTNPLPADKTYLAKLDIIGTSKVAQATISLPLKETALPPVTLDSTVDFTQTGNTQQTSVPASTLSAELVNYDLNRDGVINYADLSIILQNFGAISGKNPKADLNNDKVIDQKDANLLLPYVK